MHISPYTAEERVPAELQIRVDNTVTAGTFVAVLDETSETKYQVAKVLEVAEQMHTPAKYCVASLAIATTSSVRPGTRQTTMRTNVLCASQTSFDLI